ncbi:DNA sulfur modification protein DndB [Spirulina sp. CCNP1310]|uniref:DNA sulfur modification protein DndB n=1 Tax=Spirulina sp. CCNP1310 TaxID=3110249 RepID=UPI002B2157B9|nr:DNA sulfur modification protein DndB [Spirulina sp. CCNP1310]MEA5417745.1 DNA sulfur modification protein DndB [Spirulina sp. CCNP1310]
MFQYFPVLQAYMGDWVYYVTVMKLGQIASQCQLVDEICFDQDLDSMIQKEISDQVQQEMVSYLKNNPQRFYGALVVAVHGGDPEFSPVRINEEYELIDDSSEKHSYGFGLLRFDGSEIFYVLDGRHRLRSIQMAVKEKPELRNEEISVILLKHESSPAGVQRTTRLFSTLTRHAKSISND